MDTTPAATYPVSPQTTAASTGPTPTALFIGVCGVVDVDHLRTTAQGLAAASPLLDAAMTIAYPGAESTRSAVEGAAGVTELLSYPLPTAEGASSPWAQTAAVQVALLQLASEQQAQTIVLIHPDLKALTPELLSRFAEPVRTRSADLVVGAYNQGPLDGLINTAILAPLTRALYGKRVRFPLAADFAVSPRMAARLAMAVHGSAAGHSVLWPVTVAAGIDGQVMEALLPFSPAAASPDVDLNMILSQLVGSAFSEMETHAPLWQRVRGSQTTVIHAPSSAVADGTSSALSASEAAREVDTSAMVDSFVLGSRSLQDVWGLILPPVTLLDLKRLSRMTGGEFRIPDELWVRIVYDFALAHRLRSMNRTHLLGALKPLYLGWVASYIHGAAVDPGFHAAVRSEQLARAFEDGKPYLVRRWRWPDRFNP